MDILSETIATIRTGSPTSGMFIRHAPWGRGYPVVPGAGFHVVLQGSCWLVPPNGAPMALGVGDVVFMPRGTVDLLAADLAEPRQGSDAAVPALLETMLLFILRAWLDEQSTAQTTGWAGAFADPAVAAALRAVHEEPARSWTVPDLSHIAGVSRATLARRFTATVGEPPLTYVTRWRMLTAARLLRDTDAPLAAVARKVGYTSEFAFAKAFKREYGLPPGQYRRAEDKPPLIAV
ncbi:AraC family transcriptional regulator [Nocardia sp. NBC_01499]|uniref:helix-turn-helix transcriptional regulator n=1 Tax=Nocardia sp. NBC_01499 TaxID=2903597 RepID=UPI00386A13E3